jgi:hypothetical protein
VCANHEVNDTSPFIEEVAWEAQHLQLRPHHVLRISSTGKVSLCACMNGATTGFPFIRRNGDHRQTS